MRLLLEESFRRSFGNNKLLLFPCNGVIVIIEKNAIL
jgi:hypothetical protein